MTGIRLAGVCRLASDASAVRGPRGSSEPRSCPHVSLSKGRLSMTDTNQTPEPVDGENAAVGDQRPDKGLSQPGQNPGTGAPGGEGAAGAGGPDGFGTGT